MYKHKTSIIGRGARVIGHMEKDSVKKVSRVRATLHVETRKGKQYLISPFRVTRVV